MVVNIFQGAETDRKRFFSEQFAGFINTMEQQKGLLNNDNSTTGNVKGNLPGVEQLCDVKLRGEEDE